MTAQVEKVELYASYLEGLASQPLVLILREAAGDKLWLACLITDAPDPTWFCATPISKLEIHLITRNLLSLHGVARGRPWREVQVDDEGYYFTGSGGDEVHQDHVADPGGKLDFDGPEPPDELQQLALFACDLPDGMRVLSYGAGFVACKPTALKTCFEGVFISEPDVQNLRAQGASALPAAMNFLVCYEAGDPKLVAMIET